jgi:uncharacterized sulfatase
MVAGLAAVFARECHAADRPNVLFIAIDDLANALGCYGNDVVKTPHLDRLAAKGVRFDRAYCQLPLCNPSRASVLTGLRPDVIRVYDLDRHFREEIGNTVTLPQLFRKNQWYVARVGKLYHYNVPKGIGTNGLDDPESWDEVVNPKGRDVADEHLIFNPTPERPVSAAMSWLAADGSDEEQTDGMIATEAINLMKQHAHQPFFLGVGFFRPHTPYVAPKQYFDLYPLKDIQLPVAPANDRDDIPLAAFAHNNPIPNYGLDELTCRKTLRAYYACVSFVDAQIGRLLAAVEELGIADNTIVVVWSDHGYHLGEHNGVWQKRMLFEESARAPLIIYSPDQLLTNASTERQYLEAPGGVTIRRTTTAKATSGNGTPCQQVVEFVDIYPTVAELCGLKSPPNLSGRSLLPLLRNPKRSWNGKAFTQILRLTSQGETVVGRSIRTDRWRYIEWDEGRAGSELYDHMHDPQEFENLADRKTWQSVTRQLHLRLMNTIQGTVPQTPFNVDRL